MLLLLFFEGWPAGATPRSSSPLLPACFTERAFYLTRCNPIDLSRRGWPDASKTLACVVCCSPLGLLSSILPTVYKYCEVGGGQSHQKMEGRTSPVTRSENNERTLEIEEQVNCLLFFLSFNKDIKRLRHSSNPRAS